MLYKVCFYLKLWLHSKEFVVLMGWPTLSLIIHDIKLLYHGTLIKFTKKTVCSNYWTWDYWISALKWKECWVFNKGSFQYIFLDFIKRICNKTIHYYDIHSIYSVYICHKYTIYPSTITNYDMLGWMLCLFRIITLSDSVTIDVISNKKLESIFVEIAY